MTLREMIQQLDELSSEERNELRRALDLLDGVHHPHDGLSSSERIRRLHTAADKIREGFTDEEWAEVEDAINADYIEPIDDEQWKD